VIFAYQVWNGYHAFILNVLIHPLALLAIVGIGIGINLTQSIVWTHVVMRELGVSITWRRALKGYMLSALARYIPGGIWGYLSRSQWLNEVYGTPYRLSNIGSFFEVAGLIVAAVSVMMIYLGNATSSWLGKFLFFLAIIIPLGVWWVWRSRIAQFLPRSFSSQAFADLLKIALYRWLIIVAWNIIVWFSLGYLTLLALQGLGVFLRGNLLDVTFAFMVAWLVGFVVFFVPSGLGFRELALSNLLVTWLGVTPDLASAASVVIRFSLLLAEFLCLVCVLWLDRIPSTDQ